MKVVYVTSFYPPDRIAGAELGTQFMARHMAKQGDEVHVLIARPSGPSWRYRREVDECGVVIHWMPYLNVPGIRLLSECWVSFLFLLMLRPDWVHGNCLLPGGAVAAMASRVGLAKGLVLCYGYDVCDMKGWTARIGRWALRSVDKVLVATRYCGTVVRSHVPHVSSEVFYAGCDERVFAVAASRLAWRDQVLRERGIHGDDRDVPPELSVQLSPKGKTILFIGRMIPEKGFDFLLEVMTRLPLEVRCLVVGGGERRPSYEAMVQKMGLGERIDFMGVKPNGELPEVFESVDAFVLPSYREPFGVVCIEAILSGVPVVCSDVMGLPEAVADGKNGLVVSGRDPEVWRKAIQRALSDEDLKLTCIEQGLGMRERWSWTKRLEALRSIYSRA